MISMIFHVCTAEEWHQHQDFLFYQPANFSEVGFIHCCYERQLAGVLERYFKGRKNLLLLYLEERRLGANIMYEAGPNKEIFPHVYGTLNKDAIVKIENL